VAKLSKRGWAGVRLSNLHDLLSFVRVADAGGFRSAAARNAQTQSHLSRRVQRLEDQLGASLFERRSDGVRLTTAGVQFRADIADVLTALDAAVARIGRHGTGQAGTLKLGLSVSIGAGVVPDLLAAFLAEHPGINFMCSEGSSADVMRGVQSRTVDVALAALTGNPSGLDLLALGQEQLVAVMPKSHALAEHSSLSIAQLAGVSTLVSSSGCGPDVHAKLIEGSQGFESRLDVKLCAVTPATLMGMASLGLGVAILMQSEARHVASELTVLPIDELTLPLSMAWSPDNDNPALRRFVSLARVHAR
jgi:DNA-binding transcriptional LysR family regulator